MFNLISYVRYNEILLGKYVFLFLSFCFILFFFKYIWCKPRYNVFKIFQNSFIKICRISWLAANSCAHIYYLQQVSNLQLLCFIMQHIYKALYCICISKVHRIYCTHVLKSRLRKETFLFLNKQFGLKRIYRMT